MTDARWTEAELQLLADLLAGVRSPDDAEAARALAANPALAAEYRELAGIADGLATAGASQREAVASVLATEPDPEDVALARRFLQQREPDRARRPILLWLAAAALLITAILIFAFAERAPDRAPGRGGDETILGASFVESMRPQGEVGEFDNFTWLQAEVGLGGYYLVEVSDEAGQPVFSEEVETNTWRPTGAERQTLEQLGNIRWRVTCKTASETLGPFEVRAWRRPR